jgi:hypothetical protein
MPFGCQWLICYVLPLLLTVCYDVPSFPLVAWCFEAKSVCRSLCALDIILTFHGEPLTKIRSHIAVHAILTRSRPSSASGAALDHFWNELATRSVVENSKLCTPKASGCDSECHTFMEKAKPLYE